MQKLPFTSPTSDVVLREYNKNIAQLERSCKKLFIQGVHPIYPLFHLNAFIDALESNDDLSAFHLDKKTQDLEMSGAKQRILSVNCTKCEVYDTANVFAEGNVYLGFDPDTLISYMDCDIHFTPAGLEKLRPIYRAIIEKLNKENI